MADQPDKPEPEETLHQLEPISFDFNSDANAFNASHSNQSNRADIMKKYLVYMELPKIRIGDYRKSSCVSGNVIRFHFLLRIARDEANTTLRLLPIKAYKAPVVNFAVIHRPFLDDENAKGPIPKSPGVRSPLIRYSKEEEEEEEDAAAAANTAPGADTQMADIAKDFRSDAPPPPPPPPPPQSQAQADESRPQPGQEEAQVQQQQPQQQLQQQPQPQQDQPKPSSSDSGSLPAAAVAAKQQLQPQQDQPHPQQDQAKPQQDQPKPQQDQAKPQQDQPHPQQDQPKPQQDQSKPQQDQPNTQQDQSKPQQDQPKPQQDQPNTQQDQPKPQQDQPKPSSSDSGSLPAAAAAAKQLPPGTQADQQRLPNQQEPQRAAERPRRESARSNQLEVETPSRQTLPEPPVSPARLLSDDNSTAHTDATAGGYQKQRRPKKYFVYCELPKVLIGDYRNSSVVCSEIIHAHFLMKIAKDEEGGQPQLQPIRRYHRPKVNFAVIHRSLLVDNEAIGPIPRSRSVKSPMIKEDDDAQEGEDPGGPKDDIMHATMGFCYGRLPRSKYELVSQWSMVPSASGVSYPELVLSKAEA